MDSSRPPSDLKEPLLLAVCQHQEESVKQNDDMEAGYFQVAGRRFLAVAYKASSLLLGMLIGFFCTVPLSLLVRFVFHVPLFCLSAKIQVNSNARYSPIGRAMNHSKNELQHESLTNY